MFLWSRGHDADQAFRHTNTQPSSARFRREPVKTCDAVRFDFIDRPESRILHIGHAAASR